MDYRPLISGALAMVALGGTISTILLDKDPTQIAVLSGMTTTFGAYALGMQSQVRGKD